MRYPLMVSAPMWFRPGPHDPLAGVPDDQPLASTISHVNPDGSVNLSIIHVNGATSGRTGVTVWDNTDLHGTPPIVSYCERIRPQEAEKDDPMMPRGPYDDAGPAPDPLVG